MRLIDRMARGGVQAGLGRRSTALLETRGRRSGEPRVTPVTNGLDGDRFWIVSEHGRQADYVRNLVADPRVRVLADGVWRRGIAQVVDDDPGTVLDHVARLHPRARGNVEIVRRSGPEHVVIRIDLED